jgi:hypothetical protein
MSLEQEFLEEFGTFTFSDETPAQRGLGWSPAEDERDLRAEDYLTAERTSGKAFSGPTPYSWIRGRRVRASALAGQAF